VSDSDRAGFLPGYRAIIHDAELGIPFLRVSGNAVDVAKLPW